MFHTHAVLIVHLSEISARPVNFNVKRCSFVFQGAINKKECYQVVCFISLERIKIVFVSLVRDQWLKYNSLGEQLDPKFEDVSLSQEKMRELIKGICDLSRNRERQLWTSTSLSVRLSVRPSAHPHVTTRIPLDGFSWNLIFQNFSKICRENSCLIKIWQD
jgi:hypothetical protein